MPSLTIDGLSIEVETGTLVIDAAERLGIVIPRFCYHPALGKAGACRMCAVMFLEGPVKGLEMSCMVPARDGMVVSTTHPQAVEFRRHVIEWLMANHPHDCPVCDEGGHCMLQDTTVAGGHSVRRLRAPKRTHKDQDLGPFINHEMNRCIQCYRCVRFYREYAGGRDYGTLGVSGRVWFGRFAPGRLDSPFSGNIIDLCPTGVLTDKPSRYRARRWDMERGPSICLHCSLGCNTTAGARYRELLRVEGRENLQVNGYFLCDRGRYGHEYVNRPDRPRRARIDGQDADMARALDEAALRLRGVLRDHGESGLALLGSTRTSLESLAALCMLATENKCRPAVVFPTAHQRGMTLQAVARLTPGLACSMEDVRRARVVVVAGADPLQEAPMLALALRQVVRAGGRVLVVDPRPVELPVGFDHLPVAREAIIPTLEALLLAVAMDDEGKLPAGLDPAILQRLVQSVAGTVKAAVVCGTDAAPDGLPEVAARLALQIQGGFFPLLPGPNACGAALLDGPDGRSFEELLTAMESGEVRALVCAEADPLAMHPDHERVLRALGKLQLLVVLDYLPSGTAALAQVLLPTRTVYESGGLYVNQEGRLQAAMAVFHGGTPLRQLTLGTHASHDPGQNIPGGAPLALWDLLTGLRAMLRPALLGHSSLPASPWEAVAEALPTVAADAGHSPDVSPFTLVSEGVRVLQHLPAAPASLPPPAEVPRPGMVEILATQRLFGTEELAGYGTLAQDPQPLPEIYLHVDHAAELGAEDGDVVLVPFHTGLLRGVLRPRTDMARQTLVVPRRPGTGSSGNGAWLWPGAEPQLLALRRIWKEPRHHGPADDVPETALAPAASGPVCPITGGRRS